MYDFSDKDDGVNLANYANVYGMYMPDAMSTFSVGGSSYYVTANEGDARDYWLTLLTKLHVSLLAAWNMMMRTVV